jgi:EAL domain-containing protein (putative c-di-GMP-specific phosphodiesterase class I)
MGCDQVQGFLLARPMPEADLHEWLLTHGSGHPRLVAQA